MSQFQVITSGGIAEFGRATGGFINIVTKSGTNASVQVERELPKQFQVSVGYLHLRGLHIIASRSINVPTVSASAGIPNQGRPDPKLGKHFSF